MPLDEAAIAADILEARRDRRTLTPLTARLGDFDVPTAYRVSTELRRLREQAGERPVGRKIGFTNRNIWPEYGVFGPIWGEVYNTTLIDVEPRATIKISHLSQPRIEPEIVLGIDRDLKAGMGLEELAASIAWVAHGFEVVQTVFTDWKFAAADCIADGSLHGLLLVGPRRKVDASERQELASALAGLEVDLSCNGQLIDQGSGANVLDGPVLALKYLVDTVADQPLAQVRKGEAVTTGTMTRAFPILPGERWSTVVKGYDLPGLDVTFS